MGREASWLCYDKVCPRLLIYQPTIKQNKKKVKKGRKEKINKKFKALFERHPDSGMQSSRVDYEVVVKDHDLVEIKS